MTKSTKAPLNTAELSTLWRDARNVRATAERKGVTLDACEERRETYIAQNFFEIGCWLFYYSKRVGLAGKEGLKARIDCAIRLKKAGIENPGYDFFTVFDFGERTFDTIFEMGDSHQVVNALKLA